MKKIHKYIIGVFLLLFANACTKLDEHAYDTLIADDFYNNRNEVLSAVLRPYSFAGQWMTPSFNESFWRISELAADQLAWPTKGRHGEDGGRWKRLHYHTWAVEEDICSNAWNLIYSGVGYCNDVIQKLEQRDVALMGITEEEKTAFLAELKVLRAFHYLKLMDLFGNIPLTTEAPSTSDTELPTTTDRKEVFDFIEREVLDNIEAVPALSNAMKGRMSKAGGYAILVELYLNAETWTGTPRWDDCIAAADKLINGQGGGQNGAMALDPDITAAFAPDNDLAKEVIFSIAYDYQTAQLEPLFPGELFHFKQREIYGGGRNGSNGVVVIPGVYATYDDEDLRKKEWLLEGPQHKFEDGVTPVTGSEEYNGQPLVFVDNIRRNKTGSTVSNMSEGEENSGVRFNKYKLGNNIAGIVNGVRVQPDMNYNNTDWNVYRLTWVYFAKAEALIRQHNGVATGEAVALINACKKRAFTAETWPAHQYTVATLTLDELLAERGREFIFESFRRTDLVRFGKFSSASWWDHKPSQAHRDLFPIPQRQISLNPKLQQNPGYN